jgi:hypothetical protein
MNEKAADVQDEESAQPQKDQNNSENEEHVYLLSAYEWSPRREDHLVIGASALWIRCFGVENWREKYSLV